MNTGFTARPSARDAGAVCARLFVALELDKMEQAARLFEGERDFLSFAATDPD